MEGKICPLLEDPDTYNPDTFDLINDLNQRRYWFRCLREMVKKFISKAGTLNPNIPDAERLAETCYNNFSNLIDRLHNDTSVLNSLSIRTLLEFNEQTLRDSGFKDVWKNQKERETDVAFREFEERISYIDGIASSNERWLEIANGILAGNMFDWGAKAVTDILEMSKDFGLRQAMEKIQKRPWFKDTLNEWCRKMQESPYKLAVIFVDNAGVDFVLGMLPFVRELLKQQTKIILSANSLPALNDITHTELLHCLQRAARDCSIIKNSMASNQLVAIENGSKGPCVDLSNLDKDLCDKMRDADLIVLEGMGRSVHTNFNAKFKVDSLKLAVLKNEFLAKSLGAQQFSVIFEYVPVTKQRT